MKEEELSQTFCRRLRACLMVRPGEAAWLVTREGWDGGAGRSGAPLGDLEWGTVFHI